MLTQRAALLAVALLSRAAPSSSWAAPFFFGNAGISTHLAKAEAAFWFGELLGASYDSP